MDTNLEFDSSSSTLKVTLSGLKAFEELIEQQAIVAEKIEKEHIEKLLMVDMSDNCVSMSEMYRLIVFFVESLLENQTDSPKTAIVKMEQIKDDMILFIETVSQNRGLDLQIFRNQKEAENWLFAD